MAKTSPEFSKFINDILHKMDPKTPQEAALKRYIKIVLSMAKKYQRYGVEYEDLVMAGVTGVLEAVKDRQAGRGNFTAYVIVRITSKMYELALNNTSLMTVPSYVAKVKIYINKMDRILDHEPVLFELGVTPHDVIGTRHHPVEEELPTSSRSAIHTIKDRVSNIAKSAGTNYEEIIARASIHHIRDNSNSEEVYRSPGHDRIELDVIAGEAMEKITKGLDDKKAFALKLHFHGFNNEDIATILYEAGLTQHRVTRQAVKLMLDTANRRVRRASNLWGAGKDTSK